MSTYVIGDIQGCFQELESLLKKVDYVESTDAIWCVGDMINRGPENVAVLELLMSLPNAQCVLGNHDLHFLAIALGRQTQKRGDTLDDLLSQPDLDRYVAYLLEQPLIHYDAASNTAMVHAGIPPQFDIETSLKLAGEVERTLRSGNPGEFLTAMYGNEPASWSPALSGMDRLRLITNYFTRLRFCQPDGTIELTHKTDIAPIGFDPWFSFPRDDDLRILFGHWAALEGRVDSDFAVALDTGCVWGRELTALRLEDQQLISVPARARD